LRAARAIGKTCKGVGITHLSHEWMAEVIDRETGMVELEQEVANLRVAYETVNEGWKREDAHVAELLEAAKNIWNRYRREPNVAISYVDLDRLEQAIAKCGDGE